MLATGFYCHCNDLCLMAGRLGTLRPLRDCADYFGRAAAATVKERGWKEVWHRIFTLFRNPR